MPISIKTFYCKLCKKKFKSRAPRPFLCSVACKKKARRKVSQTYYSKNREKILAASLEWGRKFYKTKEGKERKAIYSKRDRIGKDGKTKPHILARAKSYITKRRKVDINFRIRDQLRGRVYKAVKSKKTEKWGTTSDLLGISIRGLKKYLKNKFKKGMSFENYGKWHIDHIVPVSKFNLKNKDEQRKAFHYTNLQPLWARENFKKSNK